MCRPVTFCFVIGSLRDFERELKRALVNAIGPVVVITYISRSKLDGPL